MVCDGLESSSEKSITILLVEDDAGDLRKLKVGIRRRLGNITIEEAARGQTVCQIMKERKLHFDLMILDYGLPDIDGSEVLKLMKKNGYTKVAIGFTRFRNVLEEMKQSCAIEAFCKSDRDAFFTFLEQHVEKLRAKGNR